MARQIPFVTWLLLIAACCAAATSNLRPPPTSADVSFDTKSFLVGQQRRLILSAGVHYFRIPPEEWRDRLLMTRLAGFNMIETPVPWSLHQPTKDGLRLDGPADLPRFLDLCQEMKLLVFLRIGPYVNAALTRGGLPAWLGGDPKLLVRSTNERFIQAVQQFWAKLLPLIISRQVPKGPVALIQIEDNYQGADTHYLSRLFDEVRDAGFRVPIVLSDLNPCKSFQQIAVPDTAFFATTELMPEGPLAWGERRKPFEAFGDLVMEGIAKGIDGFNHSMWAAGTNLVLLPASGFPTRYEAATSGLLEAGGASPVFHQAKKTNWFARAFEDVLTQATTLREHSLLDQGMRAGLVAYGRSDGRTSLLFFKRRYGEASLPLKDPATGEAASLPTNATEFRHVVTAFPLTAKSSLAFSTAQVFAMVQAGNSSFIVIYTPLNSEAVMVFRTPGEPKIRAGAEALAWNAKAQQLVLRWKCTTRGERKVFAFEADASVQIIALEESLVPVTWVLDGAGILVGPSQVGDWTVSGEKVEVELRLPMRRVHHQISFYPFGNQVGVRAAPGLTDVKHDPAAGSIECRLDLDIMEPLTLFLRKWEAAEDLAEARPDYDDSGWRETLRPEPLGEGHHGWYRCRFQSAKAGTKRLVLENVADQVSIFLNGQHVGQSTTKRLIDGPRNFPHPAQFDLPLKTGDNLLAILAKNWGCYRNTSAYGAQLHASSGWGILGAVAIDGQPLGRWRQRDGLEPAGRSLAWAPYEAKPGTRTTEPRTGASPIRWFRTSFALRKQPVPGSEPPHLAARVYLKGLSHGAMWLNGHYVGLYSLMGAEAAQGTYLPTPWLREQNELVILEEGGQQPTEGEVRFDRESTYLPLRLEFGADAAPPDEPTKKGKARPKAVPKTLPKTGQRGD